MVGPDSEGLPAAGKPAAKACSVIANGAECEPLLHRDAVVMERLAAVVVQGMQLAMAAVGATTGIVAIKAKNQHAVEAVEAAGHGTALRVHLLGDPAGNACDPSIPTGRLIPATGRPIQVGAGFCNVATFVNSVAAVAGRVVTHTALTIAGAVWEPKTPPVPTGTVCASASRRWAADGRDPLWCVGAS